MCSAFTSIAREMSSGAGRMLKLGDTFATLAESSEASSRPMSRATSAIVEEGRRSLT